MTAQFVCNWPGQEFAEDFEFDRAGERSTGNAEINSYYSSRIHTLTLLAALLTGPISKRISI
jgi:hypothetical protein